MDLNAVAALITALAAAVTSVALLARDREQLRQLERIVELQERLPDGDSKSTLSDLRDVLVTRYAQPRMGFFGLSWAAMRMAMWGLFVGLGSSAVLLSVPALPSWLKYGLTCAWFGGLAIAVLMILFVIVVGAILVFRRWWRARKQTTTSQNRDTSTELAQA